jgi:hypothetical protein
MYLEGRRRTRRSRRVKKKEKCLFFSLGALRRRISNYGCEANPISYLALGSTMKYYLYDGFYHNQS